ncbi:TIGR02391 family protein [Clostridium akagii]|uniref:TIGR02391 family protein n=1 Tax=Clostridium akagii TaxID=91623 RepID=UPI0009FE4BAB|nr:TIGR02391 family protein [Clostridium akagii]
MKKKHDKQFKEDAVKYYMVHKGLGVRGCAQNLDVSASTLSKWNRNSKSDDGIEVRGSGNYYSDEQKEIARLKCELRDTKDTLDVLSMSKGDYKCKNNCTIIEDKKLKEKLGIEFIDLAYRFDFKVCVKCGALYPASIKKIKAYYNMLQLPATFNKALDLLYISQYESAVREAIIVLENEIQKMSGLRDFNGFKLISEAFKYSYDSKNARISLEPKIKINSLGNITERNEYEGLQFMLMGFFKGIRNIYMHKNVSTTIMISLNLIPQIAFYYYLIHSEGPKYTK